MHLLILFVLCSPWFFGDYYGTPAGCGWAVPTSPGDFLPSCHETLPPYMGSWPAIRLESQTGYWFPAPKTGFDYIVSGPTDFELSRGGNLGINVILYAGFYPDAVEFPTEITGTVPVTLWVQPVIIAPMDLLNDSYTYTIHVPDNSTLVGVEIYHQVVIWWIDSAGILRVVASQGVKTTIEAGR